MYVIHSAVTHKHYDSLTSTMDKSAEEVRTLSDPKRWILITGDEQTKGIGTQERKWISPSGANIYATYVFAIDKQQLSELPQITHVVGYSVFQVLKSLEFEPKVKWVNDILLDRKKICGILTRCEQGRGALENFYILEVGIGMNVNVSQAVLDQLDQPATSLFEKAGKLFDRNLVLNLLTDAIFNNIQIFCQKNFSVFFEEINRNMEFVGEQITVESGKNRIAGTLLGLNEKGYLQVMNNSEIYTFLSGSIIPET